MVSSRLVEPYLPTLLITPHHYFYVISYTAGALSGDMDYAISCLFQYATCALNSCGEELGMLEKRIRLYIRRAIQFRQILPARSLVW